MLNDPSNWRGIFYFNKMDDRVFVTKRNKYLGWTINFAQPKSYLYLVNLLLIIFLFIQIFE